MSILLIRGDARRIPLADNSVNCCVTSPPYWGLRDYGTARWEGGDAECDHRQGRPGAGRADGIVDERGQRNRDGVGSMGGDCQKCGAIRIDSQLGLERTPEEYIAKMVEVFREVRRVLRDDGTCWVNMGDSYGRDAGKGQHKPGDSGKQNYIIERGGGRAASQTHFESESCGSSDGLVGRGDRAAVRNGSSNLKPKDLVGIPWMLAFALRADGWYLRSDIIWSKPNPMPESVTDRPTKAHEYIFLLSKNERYFYNADAIKEPLLESSINRLLQPTFDSQTGGPKDYGHRTNGNRSARKALCNLKEKLVRQEKWGDRYEGWANRDPDIGRNKRSVWEVATQPYSEAHFATFPEELIKPCILAGCPEGGVVLDPFVGSGTTLLVARHNQCHAVGIELSEPYLAIARRRLAQDVLAFV